MTECVKIKCDDCKFQENCVDYGWDGCRKFTPKPSEPMTEEEWLRQASTEQLAEFLWNYTHDLITDWKHINDPMFRQMPLKNILGDNCTKKEAWVEWLKQPHKSPK